MILNAKPFLKWAGGKSQLLPQIQRHLPPELNEGKIETYVEPFIGGGAVFFHLNSIYKFKKIVLNDYNVELVMAYKTVRDNVEELILILSEMEKEFLSKDSNGRRNMFYGIRDDFNEEKKNIDFATVNDDVIMHSAKLIFLNRTCFNGLYRLNAKGEYNVPFGDYKNPTINNEHNLRNCNSSLQGVILIHGDFEGLINHIDHNTFVYMDPPYRPLSGTSSFNNYQKVPFNDDSHKRLAIWFSLLDKDKKACLMLSNSDPKNTDVNDNFFDELYKGFHILRVSASRAINSKGSKRGLINELLITNYLQKRVG